MASNIISQLNTKLTSFASAVGAAIKQVNSVHATDKKALEDADTALDGRLDVIEPVLVASDFTGTTNTVKKYVDAASAAESAARTILKEQILGKDTVVTVYKDTAGNEISSEQYSALSEAEKAKYTQGTKTVHTDGTVDTLKQDLQTQINSVSTAAYVYKGTVASIDELNKLTGMTNGDVYNVGSDADSGNYAWVVNTEEVGGGHWDSLGQVFDFSAELTDYKTTFENAAKAD